MKINNLKPVFDKISPSLLMAMPYEYPKRPLSIQVETQEFTCLCPWSGLPDFAQLNINYVPDRLLVELKSLKYYIHSFRMVGIVHESAVNRILEDLVKTVKPRAMEVELVFFLRGGIQTTVKAVFKR
jgi:7-cyano-7-deazaguanine reductase